MLMLSEICWIFHWENDLKSMSKVVTRIARIVIFSMIFNESSFSLLISIVSTEHYNLCEKKLEREDFFGSKMKKKNFELIEKCPKPVEFGIIRLPYPSRSQICIMLGINLLKPNEARRNVDTIGQSAVFVYYVTSCQQTPLGTMVLCMLTKQHCRATLPH